MVDASTMLNSTNPKPILTIELMNGHILISCAQYDYRIASADVSDIKHKPIKEVSETIGYSVLRALSQIQSMIERKAVPFEHGKLVGVGEAAKLLKRSPSSIRRMVAHGELKAKLTHGGHRRVFVKSICAVSE